MAGIKGALHRKNPPTQSASVAQTSVGVPHRSTQAVKKALSPHATALSEVSGDPSARDDGAAAPPHPTTTSERTETIILIRALIQSP
jgi:hypothetical protein